MNAKATTPRAALARTAAKAKGTAESNVAAAKREEKPAAASSGEPAAAPAASAPPPAAPLDKVPEGLVRIRVRGPQTGRRRAGRHFGPEAQDLDVTPDELELLKADTELTVRQIE